MIGLFHFFPLKIYKTNFIGELFRSYVINSRGVFQLNWCSGFEI